ncbi:hypothetical protein VTJ04DRAFT_10721 [Mycothermus thermophilus]|uniref:uncharacterized protein n=1 Tax=Humicola insolens TaxID=85995 RepID=UPI003743999A
MSNIVPITTAAETTAQSHNGGPSSSPSSRTFMPNTEVMRASGTKNVARRVSWVALFVSMAANLASSIAASCDIRSKKCSHL